MDRLRRRERQVFTGFTKDEVQKMERLNESGEDVLNKQFCQTIATRFSRSAGRAGKPVVKWTEVHSWFESMKKGSEKDSKNVAQLPVACALNKQIDVAQFFIEEKIPDLSELEFEARSSKDGAWYDVEMFFAHRFLSNGEAVSFLYISLLNHINAAFSKLVPSTNLSQVNFLEVYCTT